MATSRNFSTCWLPSAAPHKIQSRLTAAISTASCNIFRNAAYRRSTPLRATTAERALADGASIEDAAARAADGTSPFDDVNASTAYREHLARVLTRRALEEAATR